MSNFLRTSRNERSRDVKKGLAGLLAVAALSGCEASASGSPDSLAICRGNKVVVAEHGDTYEGLILENTDMPELHKSAQDRQTILHGVYDEYTVTSGNLPNEFAIPLMREDSETTSPMIDAGSAYEVPATCTITK